MNNCLSGTMSLGANLLSIFVPSYFLTVTKQEDKENICNADCVLYALWVDPQWRCKGGGNYMLRAAEYNSKLKGAKTIALIYHPLDTPKWVLDWYIANGYKIKDEDEEYKVLVKTL